MTYTTACPKCGKPISDPLFEPNAGELPRPHHAEGETCAGAPPEPLSYLARARLAGRTIHLAESSSALAKPVCKTTAEPDPVVTTVVFETTCEECLPCDHVMAFLRETRERAKEHFVTIEQIHCHCCSGIWELPQ